MPWDKDYVDVESLNLCGCEYLLPHDKCFEQGERTWVSVERCPIRGCERIRHYHHKSVKEGPHAESPASCGPSFLVPYRWPWPYVHAGGRQTAPRHLRDSAPPAISDASRHRFLGRQHLAAATDGQRAPRCPGACHRSASDDSPQESCGGYTTISLQVGQGSGRRVDRPAWVRTFWQEAISSGEASMSLRHHRARSRLCLP